MIEAIARFFSQKLSGDARETEASHEHRLLLATAALLVEVMRIDADMDERERERVLAALRRHGGLDEAEAVELMALADEESRNANDYFQFTSLVNRHYDARDKARIIEMMWQVAYADGEISAHERHLMRRIADLLHVQHGDYVAAQRRAREAIGLEGRGGEASGGDAGGGPAGG